MLTYGLLLKSEILYIHAGRVCFMRYDNECTDTRCESVFSNTLLGCCTVCGVITQTLMCLCLIRVRDFLSSGLSCSWKASFGIRVCPCGFTLHNRALCLPASGNYLLYSSLFRHILWVRVNLTQLGKPRVDCWMSLIQSGLL